jgi:PAS domain S-box-containing protein
MEVSKVPLQLLIVDDSEDDALLLKDELRKNGFDPDWMREDDPEDMERALRERNWDIIIADYTMPGFGGPEALKLLQDTGLDIPFILVSGTTSENTCVDVMRSGAQDFIMKHSLFRLAPAVKRELSEAESRKKRRQAEENAARLAAIVESSEDAIIGKRFDGVITTWNHGAEKMYGYSAEEMLGQPFEVIISPEHREELHALIEKVRLGEAVSRVEMECLTKDGKRLNVAMSVSPIKDHEGRIVGASTITRDITDMKKAYQREQDMEAHKREFYRRTILAATDGKLVISEKEEIDHLVNSPIASWSISNKEDLSSMRDDINRIARQEGMDESRIPYLLGCVVEAAANAIKHANGGCALLSRLYNALIFMMSDSGPGIGAHALPDVALVRGYSTAGTMGLGYKIIIRSADRVYLATGPEGTTVAVEMGLQAGHSARDVLLQRLSR